MVIFIRKVWFFCEKEALRALRALREYKEYKGSP